MLIPDCSEDAVNVASGGFSDVSQGTYKGRRVAIKVVRIYVRDLDAIRSVSISLCYYTCLVNWLQGFCREAVAWKHLRHPNILPLLGVILNERRFALVSEWMENGTINEFVERDRDINRVRLVRCHLVLRQPH